MSIAAVSDTSIYQELQAYFQQRRSDVAQLGQDLNSGDLASAQQDFVTLETLGQGGPFRNGDVFAPKNQREKDFVAIGEALQAGDLAAAQKAFADLESTFKGKGAVGDEAAFSNITAATSTISIPDTVTKSIYQQVRDYYHQRKADIGQLGQDLTSGSIESALQDFNALLALGESGPFKSGNPFSNRVREQDFSAIGKALQAGDLEGAQKAYADLVATFQKYQTSPPIFESGNTTNPTLPEHQTEPPIFNSQKNSTPAQFHRHQPEPPIFNSSNTSVAHRKVNTTA